MEITETAVDELFVGDENSLENNTKYKVKQYHVTTKYAKFRFRLVYHVESESWFLGSTGDVDSMLCALSPCCDEWVSDSGECRGCNGAVSVSNPISLGATRPEALEWAWGLTEAHVGFPVMGTEALLAPTEMYENFLELQSTVRNWLGIHGKR